MGGLAVTGAKRCHCHTRAFDANALKHPSMTPYKGVTDHIDPQGNLVDAKTGASPCPAGMVHDMAITDQYVVVPLPPVKLNFSALKNGGAEQAFAMDSNEPMRICGVVSGKTRRFDHGENSAVEEHLIVPKPGQQGELNAWLLGTRFDVKRQLTVLNVLDAARTEDGPVAQASLPCKLPFGFHGHFAGD